MPAGADRRWQGVAISKGDPTDDIRQSQMLRSKEVTGCNAPARWLYSRPAPWNRPRAPLVYATPPAGVLLRCTGRQGAGRCQV
jgi:hypothetical protein